MGGVKCPECVATGQTSSVYPDGGPSRTLLMPLSYFDEDGRSHHHDPNTTTEQFSCTNGHHWTDTRKGSCWCGWSANRAGLAG